MEIHRKTSNEAVVVPTVQFVYEVLTHTHTHTYTHTTSTPHFHVAPIHIRHILLG